MDDAHHPSLHLGSSIKQVLSFSKAGTTVIDDHILHVARRAPEEVENGDPVIRMNFGEGIVFDPNPSQIGQGSKSCGFHGITQFVVLDVQILQREKSFHSRQSLKPVRL